MIETGRPVVNVAAEISVGEQVLGHWVRLAKDLLQLAILARCWMPMSVQSWSVYAEETPNYVWHVHF